MSDDKKLQEKKIPVGNSIEQLFKMLALQQQAKDADINKKKDMEDYKFWKTQPVPRFEEDVVKEGPIDEKTVDQVPKEPSPLPGDFEWITVDIEDPVQIAEVYDLLYYNYIEDDDEEFRFKYSPKFLEWALKCPGWHKEWMVGVRVVATKKLVGFISAIPSLLRVRDNDNFKAAEVNFLCVHKKLRSKRLAPVLIREVTRRVNLKDIWQALYTGGRVLPSPVSTTRYYHRPLNWNKLFDVGFSSLPDGSTPAKETAYLALPKENTVSSWRKMNQADVPEVKQLLDRYLQRFSIAPVFDEEEVAHWFLDPLHQESDEAPSVISHVIEEQGKITDFASFFVIESKVLGKDIKHDSLSIAYGFYYATQTGISDDGKIIVDEAALKKRLSLINTNALISSKNIGNDVYNALTVLDNNLFFKDLKFREGSGLLRYYLFNYKAFPIPGGIDTLGQLTKVDEGGVGVLLF